ncbi:SIS domain-containing protein [Corynebacterium aquilae]|uniref:Sugar isomerase n=1 Tax=Corynebacterium aquilae DSM 44791 TaxID=1431546 RepID=A0A1L7CIC5_9CORY|nr:SIS domain-containing protein [Corynebacterium aquilae]APT85607.1 sugar isomerase [Corynebacterium aquilae DSM 44791]
MSNTLGAHMEAELYSQPEMWRKVTELDNSCLPTNGERVVVIGCGTSWFMAMAYAAMREAAGQGLTDAFTATEVPMDREYDVAIVITRSGTTSEIIDYLTKVKGTVRTIALLGAQDTPVAELADDVVNLEFADEQSVVQTRFATTALSFLRGSVHGKQAVLDAADQAAEVLQTEPEAELINAEQYSFLGLGWVYGVAIEAGLKMRESCQAWTESYQSMEYRHGPIAIAAPGRITWQLGTSPEGLAEQVKATGARYEDVDRDPLAQLVRVHQVALLTARARGLNPDEPRNLTRSVILK